MKTLKRRALFLLLFVLPACGQQLVEFSKPDAAQPDVAKADVASADGVNADVRNADSANMEVANADVANADVANADVASVEVANADVASSEAANGDGAKVDFDSADTRSQEAGNRDSTGTETPIIDSGSQDATNKDAADIDVPIGDVRIVDGSHLEAPILDTSPIDSLALDAVNTDSATVDAQDIDVGGVDGSGAVPVIVIDLGLASPFAIAATAGVTNTSTAPMTHINGNVVLTPDQTCNAVTVDNAGGFGLCGGMPPTISGTVITNLYPDTTTASAIKASLNAAFLSITPLAGPPAVGSLGGGTPIAAATTLGNATGSALVLGDNWFTPGVYTSITSILITGDVTLDGQGDPNAIFIFQSASSLTTADGAPSPGAHTRILLTNGTKASNVWWQVASSATMGSYCEFQGNILAAFDITMKTGSTACGRSMAGAWVGGAGAFIFDSNVVSVPGNGCPL